MKNGGKGCILLRRRAAWNCCVQRIFTRSGLAVNGLTYRIRTQPVRKSVCCRPGKIAVAYRSEMFRRCISMKRVIYHILNTKRSCTKGMSLNEVQRCKKQKYREKTGREAELPARGRRISLPCGDLNRAEKAI